MAAARVIEEESGTFRGFYREHNGYHAGHFPGCLELMVDSLDARVPTPSAATGLVLQIQLQDLRTIATAA